MKEKEEKNRETVLYTILSLIEKQQPDLFIAPSYCKSLLEIGLLTNVSGKKYALSEFGKKMLDYLSVSVNATQNKIKK